ncbi:SEC31_3 [Sanghuangporus weigelae]
MRTFSCRRARITVYHAGILFQWCPRSPDPLATTCFDGTIGIHSIQTTNEAAEAQAPAATPKPDGSDVFDVPGFARTTQTTLQPPKWLRRPTSASFGYGEKLVSICNVVTEPDIISRARALKAATDGQNFNEFAQKKSADAEARQVHDTASLLKADPGEELVTLFGFSKTDIVARVVEAVEKIKSTATPTQPPA